MRRSIEFRLESIRERVAEGILFRELDRHGNGLRSWASLCSHQVLELELQFGLGAENRQHLDLHLEWSRKGTAKRITL